MNAFREQPAGDSDGFLTIYEIPASRQERRATRRASSASSPHAAMAKPRIVFSSLFGGDDVDFPDAIAVDAAGRSYIAGTTWSSDYPIVDAFQAELGGNSDFFITAIDASNVTTRPVHAAEIVYSSLLGGSVQEFSRTAILVDRAGFIHFGAATRSPDFPTMAALQQQIAPDDPGDNVSCAPQTCEDLVIATFSPLGNARLGRSGRSTPQLLFSTFWGGGASDFFTAMSVDRRGAIYLSSSTSSRNFPKKAAPQGALAGSGDLALVKISR